MIMMIQRITAIIVLRNELQLKIKWKFFQHFSGIEK